MSRVEQVCEIIDWLEAILRTIPDDFKGEYEDD